MAELTADPATTGGARKTSMFTVVAASSAGTAFEWYDFFIFGSLTQIISKTFFAGLNDTAGTIAALALFGVGFAFRPIGALVFGHVGDRLGRKGAFLVTVTLMGGATFAIGFLPTYAQIGVWSPILLILMRIIQGFALGGEYGGAAIYVAEHSTPGRRGWNTGWVQTSAAFGLFGALGVILLTRKAVGEDAFAAIGWRVPFLVSAGLLAVSVWMRRKLGESPAFTQIKDEGTATKAPYREAFGNWPNLKLVIIAFLSMMSAQGAVWYCSFFYVQVFMEKFLKVDPATINLLMMAATVVSALYVFFAWLSDKIGRKPVMLGGMILALIAFFPGFHALERAANPALAEASARTPVVVIADPADCALQFDPVGKAAFVSSCDIAKGFLANGGVSYSNQAAPAGTIASVRIGDKLLVTSKSAKGLAKPQAKAVKTGVETQLKAALKSAGYPAKADPARLNAGAMFGILVIFVIAATALFGPIAACLVELFPTRVRYTAMSLPYNIGTGWIGGFLPFTAFAIVAARGDIYSGLWYPVIFTLISVVTTLFFLPETRGRPLNT